MKRIDKKPLTRRDYIKCAIVLTLYIIFLIWAQTWLGSIAIPFIFDIYITRKIRWSWWKDLENPLTRTIMSWIDAIVFALVAVYFVNIYFFQNYTIPSSSLEKSLLVGDYLFVSKMTYGPRVPQTPLHMPLTQNTLPTGGKSYLEWIRWDYKRVRPRPIQQNDIVVFNYPSGDTVVCNPLLQAQDFYIMAYSCGRELAGQIAAQRGESLPRLNELSPLELRNYYKWIYALGRLYIDEDQNPDPRQRFGGIMSRPVDRRENYVKRCVGLPGQTLEIRNRDIYINGQKTPSPRHVQFNYFVDLKLPLPDALVRELDISQEQLDMLRLQGYMPLTATAAHRLRLATDYVDTIYIDQSASTSDIYPLNGNTGWTRDNYGPVWIPAKGETVELTLDNLPIYERPIRVYEGNQLDVTNDGRIIINGSEADSYTFKMDYYWMMGDNRHNSADSRYWGFVPEDHIVGKPIMVWLSLDKDRGWFSGKIRWSRMFRWVDKLAFDH